MTNDPDQSEENAGTNPLQIVALNAVLTGALMIVLKLTGWSWGGALLTSWLAGSFLTLAIAFSWAALSLRASARQVAAVPATAQAPVRHQLDGEFWKWDEDAADDSWQSVIPSSAQTPNDSVREAMPKRATKGGL